MLNSYDGVSDPTCTAWTKGTCALQLGLVHTKDWVKPVGFVCAKMDPDILLLNKLDPKAGADAPPKLGAEVPPNA